MNSSDDESGIERSGKESFLPDRVSAAFARLDQRVDQEVDELSRHLDDRLRRRLISEGLLSLPQKPAGTGVSGIFTRFFQQLKFLPTLIVQSPAVGIAGIAVLALAVVLVNQRQTLSGMQEELTAARELISTFGQSTDMNEVYAELEGAFHSKLYLEEESSVLTEAKKLAQEQGIEFEILVIEKGGAIIGDLELRESQRLVVVGPLTAKARAERSLKELLEVPDDTEGMVAIAVIEF